MLRRGLIFLSNSGGARKVLAGNPVARSMSRRFVAGESVDHLAAAAKEANAQGLAVTANYLGEAVRSEDGARAAADAYLALIDRIRADGLRAGCSLKFTQMGQDISEDFLRDNLGRVLDRAAEADVFLRFDMESSEYIQRTLDAFEGLWAEGRRGIGVVLQAYMKRTGGDVARMNELGAPVRICKGAYAEPAEVAYQDLADIRRSFVEATRRLLAEGNHPAIATHDEVLLREIRDHVEAAGIAPDRFEFQMLYGVRRDLQRQLLEAGYAVRVYIPFGEEWYPYLMRRLAERPQNLAFMVGSVVKESPLGALWPGRGDRDHAGER